jgi:hypothetical protein
VEPTDEEIGEVMDACIEQMDAGTSRYPGMSYEEGVAAALRWIQEEGENPMEY